MIDLVKEREAFEQWQYSMGSNTASINGAYVSERTSSEWFAWNNRAELAQAEITELKQKLARYENPDYVLVPREPTKEIVNHLEDSMAEIILKDDEDFIEAYKAMIEAMEKDHE